MTYEEEQIKYAEELQQITTALKGIDEIFMDPDNSYGKIVELYKQLNPLDFKYQFVSNFEMQQKINRFKLILEDDYRNKKYRKKELERLLSQTSAERTKENMRNSIGKAAGYMASITPQHVSGRVYKVENGDGCGTFCLWFCIIDAIIVFIYWLISEGFK